jgi:type II secretory pathway pseudopilin PulG
MKPREQAQPPRGQTPLRAVALGPRSGAGFTLVELTLVVSVLMFAMLAMSRSLGESMQLTEVNRENALATDAAREMVEALAGTSEFSTIFALYNAAPDDDPGGAGSAPGPGFPAQGLQAAAADGDGFVGEVLFPTDFGAGGRVELREDVVDAGLGMPRDLDGDGLTDAVDKALTYRLLPLRIRLRWQGSSGERSLEVVTLVADR